MGAGSVLPADPRPRGHDPLRPRPHHRAGALDGRTAGGRPARPRARLRGRRHRLDRRPAADAADLQPARRRRAGGRPRRHPLAPRRVSDLAGAPLAEEAFDMDIARGPREGPRHGRRALHGAARRARPHAGGRARHRHRRPRPGRLPQGPAGQAADHAGLGRLPDPALVRRPLRRAGAGRQRRQHHGPRRALGELARRPSTCCSSRSAPASAAGSSPGARSTAARRARPATSATSGWPATRTSSATAATSAASRRWRAAARSRGG